MVFGKHPLGLPLRLKRLIKRSGRYNVVCAVKLLSICKLLTFCVSIIYQSVIWPVDKNGCSTVCGYAGLNVRLQVILCVTPYFISVSKLPNKQVRSFSPFGSFCDLSSHFFQSTIFIQGKKAKRKARERQLEIARRMAMMQKRRELRAAGLGSYLGLMPKTKPCMDYNLEIPFEKQPPKGFYDTSNEKPDPKLMDFQRLRLSDVEKESFMEREKVSLVYLVFHSALYNVRCLIGSSFSSFVSG